MNKVAVFKLIFLFISSGHVFAHNDSLHYSKTYRAIGTKVHYGFIIPHSEEISGISHSNPLINELDFSWHFTDYKTWQYCSCYPRIGLSLMYINFNNPEILGHSVTLAPYVEPFFGAQKKISQSFRFLAGYAYLNNIYDATKNPENHFFSSRSSFILSVALTMNYRIGHWNLRLSGNYNHISNGGNRLPNKGMNFPTASLGVEYLFQPVFFPQREKSANKQASTRSVFKTSLFGTLKKPFNEEEARFLLFGFHFNWSYLLGRTSAITTGIEYVNDGSLKEELKRKLASPPDHQRLGLLAGHEFKIGKFRFSQQLGVYAYSPQKAKDPVYQRWGLEFLVYKGAYVGTNLKAHRHVADFMDLRLGIEF